MNKTFHLKNGKPYEIEISEIKKQFNVEYIILSAKINGQSIGYLKGNLYFDSAFAECDAATEMSFRGNGIAGNLMETFLEHIFNEKKFEKLEKVVLSINNENSSSRRVAEKVGFEIYGNDSRDSVEYVMTKEHYNELCDEKKVLK